MAKSYNQILRSYSIVGGSQAITMVIGMVRTKVVAVLLGPSGVGLIGLYQSATALVGTASGLGIGQSAIRQVAVAHGSGDAQQVARTVKVLRRACWATGILGWLLTAALAWPLSVWTFGNGERAGAIAMLGMTLLLASISGGQVALLQGVGRIGDLMRVRVGSAAAGALISVVLFSWLGQRGIVPVLLMLAGMNVIFSWQLARRVELTKAEVNWSETAREAGDLVSLGVSLLWGGLLVAFVGFVTPALLSRHFGTQANGILQAGIAVTNIYSSFILGTMETDFYPRLSACAGCPAEMNRLILEQTEIGLLLALPGVLGTIAFGPFLVSLFYSGKFQQAVEIIPLLTIASLGRILTSPLNYAPIALGRRKAMIVRDTLINLMQLLLIWLYVPRWGAYGAALAMVLTYLVYFFMVNWMAARAISFSWNARMRRLFPASGLLIGVACFLAACRSRFVSWQTLGLAALLAVGTALVAFLLKRRISEGGGFQLPALRFLR